MPFIIHAEDESGILAESFRLRTASATGSVQKGFQAVAIRGREAIANSSVVSPTSVSADRIREVFAIGRVNGDANKFGMATAIRVREVEATAKGTQNGKAITSRIRTATANGRVKKAPSDTLRLLITISEDLAERPNQRSYSARVQAESGEGPFTYPIKGFQYTSAKQDVGVSLELQLVRPADRAAILAADSFKFEIFDGANWIPKFESGERTAVGFGFAFDEGAPADVLSLTTNADLDKRLAITPETNSTIYDPTRFALSASDYKVIYDTVGRSYAQTLIPYAGLDLYGLLDTVLKEKLGFDFVEKTVPNFPVRKAEFSMQSTWYDGILPHVAAFKPFVFFKENTAWIVDSTASFPAGFGTPFTLEARDVVDPQFQENELDVDGYRVLFADQEIDFDFQSNRFEVDPPDIIGTFGSPGYQEIHKRRTFVDYFKFDAPTVPIRTSKTQEIQETLTIGPLGVLITTATETEDLFYDSFGRLQTITKEARGLVPDLSTPSFPAINRIIRRERTAFYYTPDRFNPGRSNLTKTVKEIDGLITIDSTNLHLGQPFAQDFQEAHAAGNLSAGLTVTFGKISNVTEETIQNEKGQFEMRTRTVNFLTNPPQILNSTTDARQGDQSLNSATGATGEILVFRTGASRTNARILDLYVAECPPAVAIAVAERLLKQRTRQTGVVPLLGLRLALEKGVMLKLNDRDGNEVGKYIVEGESISGTELGTARQLTRQTLEVTRI